MIEKDVVLAVLGSDIAIAGLVLVFAGFLYSKAESYQGSRSGDKYNWLAVGGLIPVVVSLMSAWMCIDALEGGQWEAGHAADAEDCSCTHRGLRHNFCCSHVLPLERKQPL